MESSLDRRIQVKIFAGFIIDPDIRREMFSNDKWHMAQIAWKGQGNGLEIIPFQNKEYVGKYLEKSSNSLEEITDIEEKIRKQLLFHCPALGPIPLEFFVFPQVFIS